MHRKIALVASNAPAAMEAEAELRPLYDFVDLNEAANGHRDAKRVEAQTLDMGAAAGGDAMLSTLAYSPCEPYGKRVKWRSLSH